MNISQFTENYGYNLTQVINSFGPFITNHTNTSTSILDSLNTSSTSADESNEGIRIIFFILIILISLFIFCLVIYVCFIIIIEYIDCFKRETIQLPYIRNNYYTSDSDYEESHRDEYEQAVFSFKSHKSKIKFQNLSIQETPVDQIKLPNQVKDEEIICTICLEPIDLLCESGSKIKVIQLNCGHIYHQDCISAWYFVGVSSVKSCPICRTNMEHLSIQVNSV